MLTDTLAQRWTLPAPLWVGGGGQGRQEPLSSGTMWNLTAGVGLRQLPLVGSIFVGEKVEGGGRLLQVSGDLGFYQAPLAGLHHVIKVRLNYTAQ